ncbi:MAG: tyrosine-type recombinase/integrase [Thermoplasmata archaeon]|jgi:site-specific recombinase XerD|nr:tyrosine-type recombinase/integrase [Candidatus Sysuiplasma jiujiangense]MBX8642971.1 tyrosine-type recombinase/integrase [Candidatus Sysuiplasma jiujiangense]
MITLRDALPQYVTFRRALGTQLQEPARTLVDFVNFMERENAVSITTELALCWATQPQGVQRATWGRRLSMVRKFAAWFSTIDSRTEVPPRHLLADRQRRKPPHIYSSREIQQLMAEAERLPSSSGLRPITYKTLIGLLASTGLRPQETLALDKADVDLETGVLAIRQTKFGKSRFVPVDDSTRQALARYAKQRDRLDRRRATEAFLISEQGRRLAPSSTRKTFATLSCAIGLRPPARENRSGRGPRLQDFRHSFVTRRLINWYRAGLDVERELPKLATYLGHIDAAHTYWYIQAVPELLQLAAERLDGRRPGGEQ